MSTYTRVNWRNSPDVSTPINANNLNVMDEGIAKAFEDISFIEEQIGRSTMVDQQSLIGDIVGITYPLEANSLYLIICAGFTTATGVFRGNHVRLISTSNIAGIIPTNINIVNSSAAVATITPALVAEKPGTLNIKAAGAAYTADYTLLKVF